MAQCPYSKHSVGARRNQSASGAIERIKFYRAFCGELPRCKATLDESQRARVHFLNTIAYDRFIALLQASTVHVYLTYPFVLSYSLLEAMSVGCSIVASDTKPLHEAITHNETGLLVDFFDPEALAESVCSLLNDPARRAEFGVRAREFARTTYDLETVCMPKQMAWVLDDSN